MLTIDGNPLTKAEGYSLQNVAKRLSKLELLDDHDVFCLPAPEETRRSQLSSNESFKIPLEQFSKFELEPSDFLKRSEEFLGDQSTATGDATLQSHEPDELDLVFEQIKNQRLTPEFRTARPYHSQRSAGRISSGSLFSFRPTGRPHHPRSAPASYRPQTAYSAASFSRILEGDQEGSASILTTCNDGKGFAGSPLNKTLLRSKLLREQKINKFQ